VIVVGAAVIAAMCLTGVPWGVVGVVAALWFDLRLGLAVAAVWMARHHLVGRTSRDRRPDTPALLRELASAIEAGATLRTAIADAPPSLVDERTRRLCRVGAPIGDVAASLGTHLPDVADPLRVIAEVSETSGGSVAASIRALAAIADDTRRRRREIRVATAQSRFSAIVVGVLPVALAAAMLAVRGVPEPGGAAVMIPMVAGATSMLAGSALVFAMASRATP
jgi:Flp pilus assembly protein TadB